MPIRQVQVSNLPAVSLRNHELEVIVVPAIGAKVTNLRRLKGREWLWRNSEVALAPAPIGSSYETRGDSGGWDECFPTIGACTVEVPGLGSVPLADHGELWTGAWTSNVYEVHREATLDSTIQGTALGFELHRRIRLDADRPVIRFEYRLRNDGRVPFPWIWAAHPILSTQPGTRIELAAGTTCRVDQAYGAAEFEVGETISWSDRLARWPEPGRLTGWAAHLFAPMPEAVTVVDPTKGERLILRAARTEVPSLGLWLNQSGWPEGGRGRGPYANLGLEPTIGGAANLRTAIEQGLGAATLAPGETRRWSLEIELPDPAE